MVPYTLPACDGADNYGNPCGGLYNDEGTCWQCCFCHRTYPSAIPGGEWEEYISEIEDEMLGTVSDSEEENKPEAQAKEVTQCESNSDSQNASNDTAKLPNGKQKKEDKGDSDSDSDSDNETEDKAEGNYESAGEEEEGDPPTSHDNATTTQ